MRELKNIEFVFENLESFVVERNVIGEIFIGNITREIARRACNSISEMVICNKFFIEIFKEGNEAYTTPFNMEEKFFKFDRFQYNDITSIIITYDNGDVETLYLDYKEETEGQVGSSNVYQKTIISQLDNCYILISKNSEDADEFLDMDYFNNKEEIDSVKKLYSIGIPEEKENIFSKDNLPDIFKYVYLISDTTSVLAVRVPSDKEECRFVFEDRKIYDVKKWQYPQQDIYNFIIETHKKSNFSLDNLEKKYKIK